MPCVRAITLSLLCSVLLSTSVARAQDALVLSGLSIYTDTARDIYLAGLLSPLGVPPSATPEGAMAMEYRIATRRISTRGYFGTLLLQAEMGSGERAPDAVIETIEQVKSRVHGSFVRGDSIVFRRGAEGDTLITLNGTTLLIAPGTETFDFFLQGWLGSNASSLLRDRLLAPELDASLETRFDGLQPSAERNSAVAAWGQDDTIDVQTATEPEPLTAQVEAKTVARPSMETTSTPEPLTEPAIASVAVASTPGFSPRVAEPAAEPPAQVVKPQVAAPDTMQNTAVASPSPAAVATEALPTENESALPDDREYQRQLSDYMARAVGKVFSNVEYPRRALKRQLQGKVQVFALVSADGELYDTAIESSSGYPILDQAALKAVREAAPFPQLSPVALEEFAAVQDDNYELPIPINFAIRESR